MWEDRASHCPLCGDSLVERQVEGRPRRGCASCAFVLYPHPGAASAAVVLDGAGRVLLVRRAIEPFRGCWAFPAGYQELHEDPAQTAVREVREESGLEVAVVGLIDLLFVPDDPRKPANVAVYVCRWVGGILAAGDDVLQAEWFALDGLPEDIGFENNRRILERLQSPGGYAGPPETPASGPREGAAPANTPRPPTAAGPSRP